MLERARRIRRERGLVNLVTASLDLLRDELSSASYDASDLYWHVRGGTQEFHVGDVSAVFDANPGRGGRLLRWRIDSEYGILQHLLENLQSGDVFYDIGASFGLHSVFAAQRLSRGEVIAFEPSSENFEQLLSNIAHNDVSVRPVQLALSNSTGTVAFDEASESITSEGPAPSGQTVQTVDGDAYVSTSDLPVPDVVKVDVEGAEPLVLQGLERTLAETDCRTVYCEVHLPADHRPSVDTYGWTATEVMRYLSDLGYTVEVLQNRDREIHLVGER